MHGTTLTRHGQGLRPDQGHVDCVTRAARRLAVGRVEAARKRDAKKFVIPAAEDEFDDAGSVLKRALERKPL